MAAPNDEPQELQSLATGSQQQDEGSIAQNIMKSVMEEQAYQDLNAKLSNLERELAKEREEKEEAISGRKELAVINAQLEEANKRAQTSYVSTSATIREYETRIRLLEEEKTELAQDCSRLQEKSKNDDNLVSKYNEKIDSDSRQIRQLDIERNEAELAKSKFQHQNNVLSAALDIARKDVEVYTKALMEKETEFSKYRTDNYLELQKAMAERDRESQARAQAQSSERVLRAQYQVNAEDLKKARAEIQELKNQLGSKTADFKSDASFLQQRVTELQNQSKADRQMVDELEQAMREEAEQHELAKSEMQEALERARSQQAEAQTKMQEMAKMVELLGADRKAGTGGSISATADLTLALQGGTADSRTVRQALADAVVLQGEVERLQKENGKLESICRTVLQEINERKPALDRQRAEWEQMKVDCAELAGQLAETNEAKKALEVRLAEVKDAQAASSEDNKVLQRQVSDLSLQLRNILRQLAIRDDPALAFEAFDPVDGSLKDESDIDLVITNSLVMFNKLPELLELNKRLLRMTRSLGQELEKKEKAEGIVDVNSHLGDLDEAANVIQELTRKIQDMESELRDNEAEVSLVTRERDMFSRMLVQGRLLGMSLESLQSEDNATVQGVLRTIRAEFDHHREDLQKELQTVQSRLDEKSNEIREESSKLADALASLRHEQSQNQMLVQKQAQDQTEITNHLETIAQRDAEIRNLRLDVQKLSDDAIAIRQEKASIQALLDSANAQRKILEANEKALNETVAHLTVEKARLDRDLSTRQLIADQEIMLVQQSRASMEAANSGLRQDLENTRAALTREQTAHRALLNENASGEELRAARERIQALEQAAEEARARHDNAIQTLQAEAATQKAALEAEKAESEMQKEKFLNANAIGLRHQRALGDLKTVTIPNLRAEHEKTLAEVRSSVETLTTQLKATRTELEAAQRDVSRLQSEVSSRDAQIQSLQADIAKASTSDASIKANTSSDVTVVQSALDAAQQRITELETQVSNFAKATQDSVDKKVAVDMQARLQAVTVELETANKQIQEMQSQLTTAQAQSQQTIADLQYKLTAAETQNQQMGQRVEELEKVASEQFTSGAVDQKPPPGEGSADDLKSLKEEYDEYRHKQETKYKEDVSRVNLVNRKLQRNVAIWRSCRAKLDKLLKDENVEKCPSTAQLAQEAKQALEEATKDIQTQLNQDPSAPQDEGVQTDPIVSENPALPASQSSSQALETAIEDLKKQLEEAKALADLRAKEARAADEKSKKLAVKANQVDKLRNTADDLRTKLHELQNAKVTPPISGLTTPMLSVKGGGTAYAASQSGSAGNAIDIAGTASGSSLSGSTNTAAMTTGNDLPSSAIGGVSVRGRGSARGTAMRARVRGGGGARPPTRGINPQAILSQVDAQFRGSNDTAANSMQVKRPAPADGGPSNTDSEEASKRPKLNEQGGPQSG